MNIVIEGEDENIVLKAEPVPPTGQPLPHHDHVQGMDFRRGVTRQFVHTMPVDVLLPGLGSTLLER